MARHPHPREDVRSRHQGLGRLIRACVALALALAGCAPSSDSSAPPSRAALHDRAPLAVTRITGSASHTDLVYDGAHLAKQTFVIEATGTASTTTYDYDGDRVAREVFTNLTTSPPITVTTTYAYGGERLAKKTVSQEGAQDAVTSYTYDTDGALLAVGDVSGLAGSYAYDQAGRLDTITSPSATWRFGYDASGRLATLQDGPGDHYTLTYDDAGRVSLVTSDEGQRFDLAYDDQGRLSQLTALVVGTTPDTFTFTYAAGTFVNMSLEPPIDGNYELRHFVDLAGKSFVHPDPLQIAPDL